jgi:hypothetical protein
MRKNIFKKDEKGGRFCKSLASDRQQVGVAEKQTQATDSKLKLLRCRCE